MLLLMPRTIGTLAALVKAGVVHLLDHWKPEDMTPGARVLVYSQASEQPTPMLAS